MVATLSVATMLSTSPAIADADCQYESNVKAAYEQKVTKSVIVDRKVSSYPIEGNFRQCQMKFKMTIGNKTIPITESYVFGPDMTENQACEMAEFKAVETIQRAYSSKVFKVQQKYDCVLNKKQKRSIFNTADKVDEQIWIQGRSFNGWKYQY
jgi:hypothetical protein